MKGFKRALLILAVIALLLPSAALAVNDGYSTAYTYTYDYWEDVQESPDAYRVETVIDSITLGLDTLNGTRIRQPQSLFVQGNDLYVCDTGNNRIIQIHWDGKTYTTARVISAIQGTDKNTFNQPSDVFVDEEGTIYVADTSNERIVVMDRDLQFIKEFIKPADATFDQSLSFLPKRLVVDVAGRVYCLVTNVNKGLVKYEADGTFTGYIGANTVSVSMGEYIWRRFFMTKAQRAQTISFVPTEYENCYIDPQGFIYVTNTVFSEYDLKSDSAKPIRRLNNLGNDILIKNDRFPPIGDLFWQEGGSTYGPSKFADITVLDNDIYVAVDRTRGRLFGYDSQGVLLWAFGTKGNTDGAFARAVSVEHMGYNLIVLDQLENSITVFTPTEYGNTIYQASEAYTRGEYDQSADLWREVLKLNANYPLAFRGIGRAVLRQNHFEEAMNYFKLAHDRENYGRAFKLYRKVWVENNILIIVLILAVVLIVPLGLGRIKKMKWEVIVHERSKVHK
ncbi:MAG: hypothetical protein IJ662_07110 [Clostridia bacterium]|nr:hypothetical protein [Clostridia bacterium]